MAFRHGITVIEIPSGAAGGSGGGTPGPAPTPTPTPTPAPTPSPTPTPAPTLPTSNLRSYFGGGDSMLLGQGAYGYLPLAALATALGRSGDIAMANASQAGLTSTDLAIRYGARDVTLGAFTVPTAPFASTPVSISFADGGPTSFRRQDSWVMAQHTGVLTLPNGNTIAGILRYTSDNPTTTWAFIASAAPASAIAVPAGAVFHCTQYDGYDDRTFLIAYGRNNYLADETERNAALFDIASWIDRQSSTGRGYLVFSVLPGLQEAGTPMLAGVQQLNQQLKTIYGDRYVDDYTFLRTEGLAFAGLTATADDTADVAAGVLPRQLYDPVDLFHLNRGATGGRMEAARRRIAQLRWPTGASGMGQIPLPTGFEFPSTAAETFPAKPQFFLRQAFGYGSAARTTVDGADLVRATFTGEGHGAAIDLYAPINPADAHAATIEVRPSKTIDMAFGLIGFSGEYGDGNGLLGTIGSPPMRLEANSWTRMAISSGEQEVQGTTLVVSVMGDGVAWAAGDTLEVRNLKVVNGSALP